MRVRWVSVVTSVRRRRRLTRPSTPRQRVFTPSRCCDCRHRHGVHTSSGPRQPDGDGRDRGIGIGPQGRRRADGPRREVSPLHTHTRTQRHSSSDASGRGPCLFSLTDRVSPPGPRRPRRVFFCSFSSSFFFLSHLAQLHGVVRFRPYADGVLFPDRIPPTGGFPPSLREVKSVR